MKLILGFALAVLVSGRPDFNSKLHLSLKEGETANIVITFSEGTRDVLDAIEDTRFDTRADKLWAIHDSLILLSERVQAGVESRVQGRFEYKKFWISNQMYVKNATLDLLLDLTSSYPEIMKIEKEHVIELEYQETGPVTYGRPKQDQDEWGIQKIQAREAAELIRTSVGQTHPVRIATIDTGARFTHEALSNNWVGRYGWHDPYDFNPEPMDINGHGTHTTGTICGHGGIGVMPEAKWMACRGCATSACMQAQLLACAQFVVCPHLPDGSGPNCAEAPNLVSNSWGGGRGNTWFDAAIAAFHTAGIIPLFSQGNSGPSCNTANSPGDRDVIGVGSTTNVDDLSYFSSVGPTIDGRMKPDVSAPGSDVVSAYNTNDTAYRSLSGTSMACPHVAGTVSFFFAVKPNITYNEVTTLVKEGAHRTLHHTGRVCDGVPETQFPNHHYGHGRTDALNSVRLLLTKLNMA